MHKKYIFTLLYLSKFWLDFNTKEAYTLKPKKLIKLYPIISI